MLTPTQAPTAAEDFLQRVNGKKFSTILADPPWQFQNRTGKVAPEHRRLNRYGTMTLDSIKALPIAKAANEPKAKLEITKIAPDKIKVIASELPPSNGKPDIVLAITENNLSTNVSRGENAGRRLNHRTVTRSLNVIGQFPSAEAAITIDKSWKRENVRIVAFLQERNNRRILGAAMIAL